MLLSADFFRTLISFGGIVFRPSGYLCTLLLHLESFTLWMLCWNIMLISMQWIRYTEPTHAISGGKMPGSYNYRFSALDLSRGFILPFQDGWSALHKAIIGKKQAITNYLLRESANPFVLDKVSRKFTTYFFWCVTFVNCKRKIKLYAELLISNKYSASITFS